MPVTVKLSQRLYQAFGDELANELVDWFNPMDATSRSDLRELNELNFARFDAKLEQRVAELRSEIADLRTELRTGFANQRADLLKWMFLFWATNALAVLGLYRA